MKDMKDPCHPMYRYKPQQEAETDIRFYNGNAIQWKGNGTYYLISELCVYCRVVCIEVLDKETERGTELVYLTEDKVTLL